MKFALCAAQAPDVGQDHGRPPAGHGARERPAELADPQEPARPHHLIGRHLPHHPGTNQPQDPGQRLLHHPHLQPRQVSAGGRHGKKKHPSLPKIRVKNKKYRNIFFVLLPRQSREP